MKHGAPLLLVALSAIALPARAQEASCMAVRGRTVATTCLGGLDSGVNPLVVSRDDGATFTQLAAHVRGMTITAHEVVYALSDSDAPSLLRFGVETTSRPIPLESVSEIRSLGDTLYVLGASTQSGEVESAVLVSEDEGVSWQRLGSMPVPPHGIFRVAVGRGRPQIELVVRYGLSCFGTVRVRRFAFDGTAFRGADLMDEDACAGHNEDCSNLDFLDVGAHGVAFAVGHFWSDSDPEAHASLPLQLLQPIEVHRETDMRLRADETFLAGDNGLITLAIAGQRLVRIEGPHHTVIDRNAPIGATDLMVDERGRAWVITTENDAPYRTHLHRFSRRTGWEELGIPTARP